MSNGKLNTLVTNRNSRGRKGTIIAIVRGVCSEDTIAVLKRISKAKRKEVKVVSSVYFFGDVSCSKYYFGI